MRLKTEPLKVLTFDLEARPLGWISADYVHKEITVAAWAWQGLTPSAKALTTSPKSRRVMLDGVRRVYDEADMVVGHYIRGYDLPLLNAMLVEDGGPPLGPKLTHDTKSDLLRMDGVSKSQVNLAAMFGLAEQKQYMTVPAWREANRLTPEGVEGALDRAVYDVAQNQALYRVLSVRRLLAPPRVWRP